MEKNIYELKLEEENDDQSQECGLGVNKMGCDLRIMRSSLN